MFGSTVAPCLHCGGQVDFNLAFYDNEDFNRESLLATSKKTSKSELYNDVARLYNYVARALGLRCMPNSESSCKLADIENELEMAIEFFVSADGEIWTWTCEALVRNLTGRGPDPMRLLMLNNDGLGLCYHAIQPYDGGFFLKLTYTFATPPTNMGFARALLFAVLINMRRCALEVTRKL